MSITHDSCHSSGTCANCSLTHANTSATCVICSVTHAIHSATCASPSVTCAICLVTHAIPSVTHANSSATHAICSVTYASLSVTRGNHSMTRSNHKRLWLSHVAERLAWAAERLAQVKIGWHVALSNQWHTISRFWISALLEYSLSSLSWETKQTPDKLTLCLSSRFYEAQRQLKCSFSQNRPVHTTHCHYGHTVSHKHDKSHMLVRGGKQTLLQRCTKWLELLLMQYIIKERNVLYINHKLELVFAQLQTFYDIYQLHVCSVFSCNNSKERDPEIRLIHALDEIAAKYHFWIFACS